MVTKHHLDRRAENLVASGVGDEDELLKTHEVANWLGVSTQWLEIGRFRSYGPKFTRISPRVIRYRRADVIDWLKARTFANTSEYSAA